METWNTLVVIFTLCTTLHGGVGLPVVPQTDPDNSSAHQKIRTKRCSCNNQLDSECHYFCHLDIIWVNTPSKTTVYGLGGPLARRRRSTGRCFCSHQADQTCSLFCHHSSENPAVILVEQEAMTDHVTGEKISENTRPPLVWESSSMSEAKTKRSDFLRKMTEARRRLIEKVRVNKHGYR